MPMPDWAPTGVPPEPCEYCAHRARCAAEELACYVFAKYTGSAGELRKPGHRINPYTPTREIFAVVFSGENYADA